jgi:signal transduction histidine kinase
MTQSAANLIAGLDALARKRERVALAEICRKVIAEASGAHPEVEVVFNDWDEAFGAWDRQALIELAHDLIFNAFAHRSPGSPVLVSVSESGANAVLSVASNRRRQTFRSEVWSLRRVREIVRAHGGRVMLSGGGNHRVFHISLPKFVS